MSLKDKTVSSIVWSGIERFSTLFIQLVCTIIIARLLTPADFGLVGMLTIFISLAQTIIDSGFGQALIRKQDADQVDYSSVFYINLVLGIIVYIVLFLCSSSIASFYDMPELELVSKISFIVLPVNALGLIQYTILCKKIDFRSISQITIYSSILSGILGICIAFYFQNVWALVAQSVSFYIFRTALLWFINSWKPSLELSFNSIKAMFGFSINLLLTGLVGSFFMNIYSLVIGKFYTPTELGYYSQADRIQKIPATSITEVIQRVTYPVLATIQNEDERLRESYRKIINMAIFIITPLMTYFILVAPEFFDLILTDKWRIAAKYFQILCLTGICYPLSCINLNILTIRGKTKLLFYLECLKKILLLVILIISIHFDIIAVVYGQLLYGILAVVLNLYFCGREIKLSIKQQLLDVFPVILSTFLMYLCVFYLQHYLKETPLIIYLLISLLVALISYFLISYTFHVKSLNEVKNIILIKLNK